MNPCMLFKYQHNIYTFFKKKKKKKEKKVMTILSKMCPGFKSGVKCFNKKKKIKNLRRTLPSFWNIQKISTKQKMSLHITTIHNIIMCVNVSNLDVFTLKKNIFLLVLLQFLCIWAKLLCVQKLYCVFY